MPAELIGSQGSRVRLKDVAEAAGVHVSTVSRALRGSTKLDAETARRVRECAERLGYVPDPMLAALARYRSSRAKPGFQQTLAWFNGYSARGGWRIRPYNVAYYRGAKEEAAKRGFALDEIWYLEPGMTSERIASVLRARGIQGVLIPPFEKEHFELKLPPDEFALVRIAYSVVSPPMHTVAHHFHHTVQGALMRLFELGYRRIGFLVAMTSRQRSGHQYEAIYDTYRLQLEPDERIPLCDPSRAIRKEDHREFLDWVFEFRPEALLVAGRTADQVTQMLRDAGVRVPDDMGVIGLAGPVDPEISHYDECDAALGARAAGLLISLVTSGERGVPEQPVELLVRAKWHEGKTIRRIGPPQTTLIEAIR